MSATDHHRAPPPAVAASRLTLAYGPSIALRDATFSVQPGTCCCVVGPNGSGKSSVLHAIAGILPPRSGTLEVAGADPQSRRRDCAYVLQGHELNRHVPVTVREVVTMGRYPRVGLWRRLRSEDQRIVEQAMQRLDISELHSRHFDELSGGQRQRALIAQALAQQGALLLLDEPLTGLDLPSRERVEQVVADERARGTTVIMTTHDLTEAAAADQVLLVASRLVASGRPESVLTTELLAAAYGGHILDLGQGTVMLDDPGHHRR
ncbi:MAG: Fe(3+) dicitrate transport ATP-binding protein FecE [Acidimicrobiales bacterium]|nr:MAG: ATP-binding cassette domain-containing protein [Actinomycetota bacterium]MBV6509041.1 Fe(3+) dicitrate transport ATP-binding protein FecE [Acidimicrobiales bacterium]RIK06251.1 MAG: metal ABC transporter ATP-binding protein [Acidobacteriota bacterium]